MSKHHNGFYLTGENFAVMRGLTLYGPGFWGAPQDPGRGGGAADSASPPQYLGLYLSVANKSWQIYKTNQNKVIDRKIMLTLQNVADVIKS